MLVKGSQTKINNQYERFAHKDPKSLANAMKDFLSLEENNHNDRIPANDDWERLVEVLQRSAN